jgi:beta-galactosidase
VRKDAFYLYKAYWSNEPFVHICGRRYVNRAEELTEIKVYSNQGHIDLYHDGKC